MSDKSELSDKASGARGQLLMMRARDNGMSEALNLPKCNANFPLLIFLRAVRAEVAFCDGSERGSVPAYSTEQATEQGARYAEMRRKKTLNGGFRCKKAKKSGFSPFFDLINALFDVILYDADGYPGRNCAQMAVCCMPDFPDAASLPARSEFA